MERFGPAKLAQSKKADLIQICIKIYGLLNIYRCRFRVSTRSSVIAFKSGRVFFGETIDFRCVLELIFVYKL